MFIGRKKKKNVNDVNRRIVFGSDGIMVERRVSTEYLINRLAQDPSFRFSDVKLMSETSGASGIASTSWVLRQPWGMEID